MVPPCSALHPMITACHWATSQFAAQRSATRVSHPPSRVTRAAALSTSRCRSPQGITSQVTAALAGREAAPTHLQTAIRGLPTRAFALYGIPRRERNRSSLPACKPSFDTRAVSRGARGRLAAHSPFLGSAPPPFCLRVSRDAPWTRRRRLLPSLGNSSPHGPLSVLGRESIPGLRSSVVFSLQQV